MTNESYLIIQQVHETIRYTFILTIKHLLHVCNKQSKPTHHERKNIRTHIFNVVHPNWATFTMVGFLYYSFIIFITTVQCSYNNIQLKPKPAQAVICFNAHIPLD
jgi:hypothetical protein